MASGNFSNGGVDTFDERKHYVGIRLQQGVPLLDRDWNELEDIRRWFEQTMGEQYVGEGVPDRRGFQVRAPDFAADNDVIISAGHCMVDGFDVWNEHDVLFSEQATRVALPAPAAGGDVVTLYLECWTQRVTAADDADLGNPQDINIETCVRDQLQWAISTAIAPAAPPAEAFVLAEITRAAGATRITDDMIVDKRRTNLRLSDAVDRITRAEGRLAAIEAALLRAQADIDSLKIDVGSLFWNIDVSPSTVQALFGEKVTLALRAVDRLGTPVQGATLSVSADWGTVQPPVVTTGADGRATVELVGVRTETALSPADIGRLAQVSRKVAAATLPNPGAIQFAKLRFEPDEVAVVSRYTSAEHLSDLVSDLPPEPIVARQPMWRTATVTVHAKEGATVRGVGSIQVSFGLWVRDWALSKLRDVVAKVQVGSRIGDVIRQGVAGTNFDHALVAERLPVALQAIGDQTQASVKQALFSDPGLHDAEMQGTGILGQVIIQEATNAIGASAHDAIATQLSQLASIENVSVAADAQQKLTQRVSEVAAGFSQNAKQTFAVTHRFG